MKLLHFGTSTRSGKKYMVKLEYDGKTKTIHFGSEGENFTEHKDPERKERYIQRHQARENWSDPLTAGYWSRWVLWNLPTIKASLSDALARSSIKK